MTPNHFNALNFHFCTRFRQVKNPTELFVLADKNQQRKFACKMQTRHYHDPTKKSYCATKFLSVQYFKLDRKAILKRLEQETRNYTHCLEALLGTGMKLSTLLNCLNGLWHNFGLCQLANS